MPLFQDFGKRVSEVAKNVGQKTQEAAEVARLNSRIAAKEAEIEELLLQIGKAYYSMRGAGACEAADMFCQKVSQLEAECEETRKEIDLLKHQSRCPNCGGVQPIEASFCASCGTKLPKPPRPEPAPQPEPEPEPEPAPEPEPQPEAPKEEPPQTMTAGSAEIIWPAPSPAPEAPAPEEPAPEAAPAESAPEEPKE